MRSIQTSIALALCYCFAGCVSTSTQMTNSDGQVVNCGAWGFGIIGAPAALISTSECVKKYQAAGYHELGSPQAASAKPSSPGASTSPVTLLAKDGTFKLILPAGWIQSPPPSPAHQIYGKNSTLDAGLLVSAVDLADIQDWKKYSESLSGKVASNLTQGVATELVPTIVNGFEGYNAEISGASKTGIKLHYLSTVVKTEKRLMYFLSWSLESRFAGNKKAFEQIPSGLEN